MKDLTGTNIYHGGRRIGAVQKGNVFVARVELTEDDWAYLVELGLADTKEKKKKKKGDLPNGDGGGDGSD